MHQWIITNFIMQFDWEFFLQKYYGRILTSQVRILIIKQSYRGHYALFGKIYKFLPDETD